MLQPLRRPRSKIARHQLQESFAPPRAASQCNPRVVV